MVLPWGATGVSLRVRQSQRSSYSPSLLSNSRPCSHPVFRQENLAHMLPRSGGLWLARFDAYNNQKRRGGSPPLSEEGMRRAWPSL
jgi:hypothetical protein